MRNRNTLIIGAVLVLLVLLGFVAAAFGTQRVDWFENYQQREKSPYGLHIFREVLASAFKGRAVREVRKNAATTLDTLTKAANAGKGTPANYVFVGQTPYYDSLDVVRIVAFVRSGGTAFLATHQLPTALCDSLEQAAHPTLKEPIKKAKKPHHHPTKSDREDGIAPRDTSYQRGDTDTPAPDTDTATDTTNIDTIEEEEPTPPTTDGSLNAKYTLFNSLRDTAARLSLGGNNLIDGYHNSCYRYRFFEDTAHAYQWYYFGDKATVEADPNSEDNPSGKYSHYNTLYLSQINATKLGAVELSNKTSKAKQKLLVNFVRIPFGRGVFLLHTTPLAFTNFFLIHEGYLPYTEAVLGYLPAADVYWDEGSKTPRPSTEHALPESGVNYKGPFDFVLTHAPLRWSLYSLLGLVALFMLFRTKRRARVVPVVPVVENTSLAFVRKIGQLHFRQRNHSQLAEQQFKHFFFHLRDRFGIPTNTTTEELSKRIVQKTKASESTIRELLRWHEFVTNAHGSVTEAQTLAIYTLLEEFYAASRNSK